MVFIFLGVMHNAAMSPTYFFKTEVGKNHLLCSLTSLCAAQESCTMDASAKEAAHTDVAAARDLCV